MFTNFAPEIVPPTISIRQNRQETAASIPATKADGSRQRHSPPIADQDRDNAVYHESRKRTPENTMQTKAQVAEW